MPYIQELAAALTRAEAAEAELAAHSPGINEGCYQVGTSSKLRLEYNTGPSGWLNTHCLIHRDGKRQLVTIIDGRWRL